MSEVIHDTPTGATSHGKAFSRWCELCTPRPPRVVFTISIRPDDDGNPGYAAFDEVKRMWIGWSDSFSTLIEPLASRAVMDYEEGPGKPAIALSRGVFRGTRPLPPEIQRAQVLLVDEEAA